MFYSNLQAFLEMFTANTDKKLLMLNNKMLQINCIKNNKQQKIINCTLAAKVKRTVRQNIILDFLGSSRAELWSPVTPVRKVALDLFSEQ